MRYQKVSQINTKICTTYQYLIKSRKKKSPVRSSMLQTENSEEKKIM